MISDGFFDYENEYHNGTSDNDRNDIQITKRKESAQQKYGDFGYNIWSGYTDF